MCMIRQKVGGSSKFDEKNKFKNLNLEIKI